MEYSTAGSSLTYQNLAEVWADFVRGVAVGELPREDRAGAVGPPSPRTTTVRFAVSGLLRADIKTRFDVYTSGITSGVLTVEDAQRMEGLTPNIENAAVPPAPPAATPSIITRSAEVRCDGTRVRQGRMVPCDKLLPRRSAMDVPSVQETPTKQREHPPPAPGPGHGGTSMGAKPVLEALGTPSGCSSPSSIAMAIPPAEPWNPEAVNESIDWADVVIVHNEPGSGSGLPMGRREAPRDPPSREPVP